MQLALLLLEALPLLLQILARTLLCCLELHSARKTQADSAVDPGHAFLHLLVLAHPKDAALLRSDQAVNQYLPHDVP